MKNITYSDEFLTYEDELQTAGLTSNCQNDGFDRNSFIFQANISDTNG